MERCTWATHDPLMTQYHDWEWGVPVHDDTRLFEMLILEGAQAGLSWQTVLNRREGYRAAFEGFDIERVAAFTEDDVERLMLDPGIIRHRGKIVATIGNARAALKVRAEFGSLDQFLWQFVNGTPVVNKWRSHQQIPAQTPASEALSAALRKRGFKFVGPTICYAFMQAVGMVNDHTLYCFRHCASD